MRLLNLLPTILGFTALASAVQAASRCVTFSDGKSTCITSPTPAGTPAATVKCITLNDGKPPTCITLPTPVGTTIVTLRNRVTPTPMIPVEEEAVVVPRDELLELDELLERDVESLNLKYNARCHDMKLNVTDIEYCIDQISNARGDCKVDPNLEYQYSCSQGDVRISSILWKDHDGDYKGINEIPCFTRRAPLQYLLNKCGSRGGAIGATQSDHDDTVLWVGNSFA